MVYYLLFGDYVMKRLAAGVGVFEVGKHIGHVLKSPTREYTLWANMIRRCYSENIHKKFPTYKDCTVSDNFKNFQFFAEWCQYQKGFSEVGWELDKDLLVVGNKTYSEELCIFIPKELNLLLKNGRSNRGDYPVGVVYHKASKSYVAQCGINGKRLHLGCFSTPELAFKAYENCKVSHIKQKAEEWKDRIDYRLYLSLTNINIKPFP